MAIEKVAQITAGGSGMWAGVARRLVGDGFKVGVLSSLVKGEALGKELGGISVTRSSRSVEDLVRFVECAMERWGWIGGGLSRDV
ncbi:MAG: hypothetical protein ACU0A8_12640 [Limimaricola soesokkakensis]|uniref:hypothetical protein n=1 Tax=Limimaricola soesokkakensis TaxID=1343159 RepID=UPI0040591EC7